MLRAEMVKLCGVVLGWEQKAYLERMLILLVTSMTTLNHRNLISNHFLPSSYMSNELGAQTRQLKTRISYFFMRAQRGTEVILALTGRYIDLRRI
jgi:hypothetical protein